MFRPHQAIFSLALTCIVGGMTLWAGAQTTQAEQKVSNVFTARAQAVFATSVTATGRVQATTCARIGPRVSGRLAQFGALANGTPVDVGIRVGKGDVLFKLDQTTFQNSVALANAQLASAQASLANLVAPTRSERIDALRQDVAQLQARVADRQREFTRYKQLVEVEKTLPPRRLEEVETELAALTAQMKAAEARLQEALKGPTATEIAMADARVKEAQAALRIAEDDLRDATILAPFDGVVTQRFKSVGDYLVNMPPTDVVELLSTGQLEAELSLPETYLPAIQQGQTELTLKSPLLKGDLRLPITRVVDQIDTARGVFMVRVAIPPQRADRLVAGAFITAEMTVPSDAGGVIVPLRCVFAEAGKPFVYIAQRGKMIRRPITLGDKLSEGIIASSGVKDGEQVLMGPAGELADGAPLPEHLR